MSKTGKDKEHIYREITREDRKAYTERLTDTEIEWKANGLSSPTSGALWGLTNQPRSGIFHLFGIHTLCLEHFPSFSHCQSSSLWYDDLSRNLSHLVWWHTTQFITLEYSRWLTFMVDFMEGITSLDYLKKIFDVLNYIWNSSSPASSHHFIYLYFSPGTDNKIWYVIKWCTWGMRLCIKFTGRYFFFMVQNGKYCSEIYGTWYI